MTDMRGVRLSPTRPRPARLVAFVLVLAGTSWALGLFSGLTWSAGDPRRSSLRISLKHVTAPLTTVVALSPEAMAKIPAHMRPRDPARTVTGRRADAILSVELDGRTVLMRAPIDRWRVRSVSPTELGDLPY